MPARTRTRTRTRTQTEPQTRTRAWIAAGTALITLPLASYAVSLARPATTTRNIHINADPDTVWAALTDFPSYPEWNPVITQISGTPAVDERLTFINRMDDRAMTFHPTVLVADPGRELRWLGRLWLPKLADGEHSFSLHPEGKGTRLTQKETFTGVLAPLTPLLMDLGSAFEKSNPAIKNRAETLATN